MVVGMISFTQDALLANLSVCIDDLEDDTSQVRELEQAPPQQLHTPEEYASVNFSGRFLSGEVGRKDVAGERGIGGNTFGNGDSKAIKASNSGRRGLTTI